MGGFFGEVQCFGNTLPYYCNLWMSVCSVWYCEWKGVVSWSYMLLTVNADGKDGGYFVGWQSGLVSRFVCGLQIAYRNLYDVYLQYKLVMMRVGV